MTRDVVRRNTEDPRRTYQTWHLLLEEPLAQVVEQHNIPFTILLYKISPFSLPNIAQVEGNWDDQQTHLYQEAMEEATLNEILAYLMSVGLSAVYQGPTQVIKRMVLNKANTCFFSFLVFARNHRKWLHALINTMYPAVFLPLKTQSLPLKTSNQTTNLRQLPEPGTSSDLRSPGEINSRVDQVALVQKILQTGATPTLVAS